MTPADPVQALHSVVHSYLATLMTLAEVVGTACPEVGAPHQQRLARLQTRLSFDTNKEAIEAYSVLVRAELRDFAAKSAEYSGTSVREWKRAAEESRSVAQAVLKRQAFYAARLREFARQMRESPYPSDPQELANVISVEAASLQNCIDSMTTETESMLARLEELLADTTARVADLEVVDRITGLMNRREMERRIERAGASGVRLLFRIEWDGAASWRDAILRQSAIRLSAQLRPEDLVARWGDSELLVLFRGTEEIASRRGADVAHLLSGPYALDGGTPILVQTHVQCLEQTAV
jgi:GGDEF domain-containing protein